MANAAVKPGPVDFDQMLLDKLPFLIPGQAQCVGWISADFWWVGSKAKG